MSIHASGMDHILFAGSSEIKIDKKKAAFKKAELYNLLNNFKDTVKPYYHISKQYYIDRNLTFIRFTTVIKSFILFTSCTKRSLLWERAQAHLFNSFKRKHSFKLPLFIPFENYRL